jgi:hypothetical protein
MALNLITANSKSCRYSPVHLLFVGAQDCCAPCPQDLNRAAYDV